MSKRFWPRVIVVPSTCLIAMAAIGASVPTAAASAVSNYQLSLLAGTPGSSGTVAQQKLNYPMAAAVNSSGDLYVGDGSNDTVDAVSSSGTLSVFAGGGSTVPTAGQTIAATSAHIEPYAITFNAAGDMFIADDTNEEVEEVTPSGQLSVIAGGGNTTPSTGSAIPATSARIDDPEGIAVNAAGDVYVSDNSSRLVYEIAGGSLTVVAGTGSSGTTHDGPATQEPIDRPTGLAVNAAGDLYIADYNSNLVDEVTPAGQLTIVAGGGSGSLSNGPAVGASLSGTTGVALDSAGDLYIVDGDGDSDVSEVTPDGQLTVIAGNGSGGAPTYGVPATHSSLDDPWEIASTPAGRIYVSDSSNSTVDLLTPDSTPTNTSLPVETGTAATGQTLTASEGAWQNAPIEYAYQWQDCDAGGQNCTDIAGATSASYTLTGSDAGHTVRVEVTAENGRGSTTADSVLSAVVAGTPVLATTTTTPVATTTSPPVVTTTTSTPVVTTSPTTTTPPAGTAPAFKVTLSSAAVLWCHGRDCRYPTNRLQVTSGSSVKLRLLMRARVGRHWKTVAVYTTAVRAGHSTRRLAGHWHGQLLPARHLQLVIQTRTAGHWRPRRTFWLTVHHTATR